MKQKYTREYRLFSSSLGTLRPRPPGSAEGQPTTQRDHPGPAYPGTPPGCLREPPQIPEIVSSPAAPSPHLAATQGFSSAKGVTRRHQASKVTPPRPAVAILGAHAQSEVAPECTARGIEPRSPGGDTAGGARVALPASRPPRHADRARPRSLSLHAPSARPEARGVGMCEGADLAGTPPRRRGCRGGVASAAAEGSVGRSLWAWEARDDQ